MEKPILSKAAICQRALEIFLGGMPLPYIIDMIGETKRTWLYYDGSEARFETCAPLILITNYLTYIGTGTLVLDENSGAQWIDECKRMIAAEEEIVFTIPRATLVVHRPNRLTKR